ncbi:hypothetical protein [Bacillus marinisedimentorum]|uniref:hypothetical protein n=1 Tax=Bacillus marinisedimentorum TaxID=1821260 RepID=UPI0007DF6A59|nr:hypothetical protein [Bacillus marinisedimentorum]
MKNKVLTGILAAALIAGGATSVMAYSDGGAADRQPQREGAGTFNFGQMQNYMEQMHPEWSKEEIKEMYNYMHGTNGSAPSRNFEEMHGGNWNGIEDMHSGGMGFID